MAAVVVTAAIWSCPIVAVVAAEPAVCTGLKAEGPPMTYRDPRWGITMTFPAVFALVPGSVPEDGGSASFRAANGQATAVVTALRNGMGQSLRALLQEGRQDIQQNSRGTITYERARDGWFVLSGHVAGRIFYRRTFLGRNGHVIATLWIEFPSELRPCLDAAVAMMSLSFREMGAP
jgi:hypothetical protein